MELLLHECPLCPRCKQLITALKIDQDGDGLCVTCIFLQYKYAFNNKNAKKCVAVVT